MNKTTETYLRLRLVFCGLHDRDISRVVAQLQASGRQDLENVAGLPMRELRQLALATLPASDTEQSAHPQQATV